MRLSARGPARRETVFIEPAKSFRLKDIRAKEFPFLWHYHPEVELTLIAAGSGVRFVGDSIEDFHDGDLCLIGASVPHCWFSTSQRPVGHRAVVIQFHAETLGGALGQLPEWRPVRALLERSRFGLQIQGSTRETVARETLALGDMPEGSLARLAALLRLLDELAASREARPLSGAPRAEGELDHERRLGTVFESIEARLASGASVRQRDAARSVGMTPPAFSRWFSRTTGRTFGAYVNAVRVSFACRELLETDEKIATVAHGAGFSTLSNFNRRFRAIKRMTPAEYRERARQARA
jgi:AraC-like DNA-binding protein